MSTTNVSVVVCSYNGAMYIEAQLLSIIRQTHLLKEILVFDDVSTDDTWLILQKLQLKYPILTIFQNPYNYGFTKNFENALLKATSSIIAISDQDDIWEEDKIEQLLKGWKDDTPVIYCDSVRFVDTPKIKLQTVPNEFRYNGCNAKQIFLQNTVSGHALLIKRSFLKEVLPFTEGIYYDWWIAFVASYNGGVSYLCKTLVHQRMHDNNLSFSVKTSEKEDFLKHRKEVIQHLSYFIKYNKLSLADRQFGETLLSLLNQTENNTLKRIQLLVFIVKNRHILFATKKKKYLPSYIKYAIKWAF